MDYFFSRRTFNQSKGKFTKDFAALTRYVGVPTNVGEAGSAHLMPQSQWLQAVLGVANSNDVVIFVHGINTSQAEMLIRQRKIGTGLRANGYDGAVIGLDWPSDGTLFGYGRDKSDAKRTAPYLVLDGIGPILNARPGIRVHVLAHSMGAYLTLRGFSQVGDSGTPGSQAWGVHQVLFLGADVTASWMQAGAWGGLVMDHRCQRLTNYYSTRDDVLALSEIDKAGTAPRAGRNGLSGPIPAGFADLYCGEHYDRTVPPAARSVRYSHIWYFDSDGVYRDAARTIAGQSAGSMPTRVPATNGDQALRA
jgi:pimeloyl-ACP methyl ester carboxylesterase